MAESPKVDNAIRRYLAEIKMAPMLEEFVAETVAERPDDIYAFMENFARRKRAEIASNNQWTLLRSWTEHAGKSEASLQRFADSFFQLLFITQRTMKKTVFAKVADDIPSAGAALAKVFDRAVRGDLSDLDLASLVAKHASDVDIEPYHFQSIITTLLLALRQSMPQEAWEILSEEWRYFCTTNSARVESAVADAKVAAVPESPASPALPTGTSISARDSWEKMPEATQHSVVRTAFETLFTQHAPLKRNFFSDVDLEALYGSLTPLLDKLMKGTLTDEDIKATGIVEAAIEKGAKAYHTIRCHRSLDGSIYRLGPCAMVRRVGYLMAGHHL